MGASRRDAMRLFPLRRLNSMLEYACCMLVYQRGTFEGDYLCKRYEPRGVLVFE